MQSDYVVNNDLFVIPDDRGFILYAPFQSSLLEVNQATVNLLQNFQAGQKAPFNAFPELFKKLVSSGVLVKKKSDTPKPGFNPVSKEFDPNGVSLLLTTACSMRCIYCYSHGGKTDKRMSPNIAKAAIDWIVNHTLLKKRDHFFVSLHGGGEITTALDLFEECAAYARQQAGANGINVRIEGGLNGVMTDSVTDKAMTLLDSATISLDGLPEIQNFQRPLANGGPSFPVVAKTLNSMDKKGFKYAIRMTVTQNFIERLPDSVNFIASNFKVENIQAEPVFLVGRALETLLAPLAPQDFVTQFRAARKLAEKHGKRLKYSGARFSTKTNVFCKAATGNSFAVTPDGYVTSCYEVTEPNDPRAGLFFYGKFDRNLKAFTFNHDKIATLKRLTVENKPYCSKCFCKWHCAGDCPAKLAFMGDAWLPDHSFRCRINQELTKDQIKKELKQM